MAAGAALSLQQIAHGEGVSYQTAVKWAKRYGWLPVRRANRTLGISALYDYDAVQADLGEREQRAA